MFGASADIKRMTMTIQLSRALSKLVESSLNPSRSRKGRESIVILIT